MTQDEIHGLVVGLGDIHVVLRSAEPEDKAEVYRQLGVALTLCRSKSRRGTSGGVSVLVDEATEDAGASHLAAMNLRCQASSVAGVTGKTSHRRRRGMRPDSAATQKRSAGS